MGDDVLEIRKMTIDEVKQNPPAINRKFILINSSLYTNEAFEYILELVNETDSILFIRDTKKIYTHGEYFGGDLWEDSLFYFGNFQILNDADEVKVSIEAEEQKETLKLKGINNLDISAEENYIDGIKYKTIVFNYDISNVVDTTPFTVDDPTAEYKLEIKDSKIHVNKYIPIRVEVPNIELPVLEYNNAHTTVNIPINVFGTDTNKNIFVSSSTGESVRYDEENSKIILDVTNSVSDNDILIVYSDSRTQGSLTLKQKFSFACVFGQTEPSNSNFNTISRYVCDDKIDGEITIEIDRGNYGWFACPENFNPIFIDKESNLSGGWTPVKKALFYVRNIKYTIYRTENSGLGHTKWIIKNFE